MGIFNWFKGQTSNVEIVDDAIWLTSQVKSVRSLPEVGLQRRFKARRRGAHRSNSAAVKVARHVFRLPVISSLFRDTPSNHR
jgi:hypothetical protein